jgi:hypothetical protein
MKKSDLALLLKAAPTKVSGNDDLKMTKADLKSALSELRSAWDSGNDGVDEFLAARDIAKHIEE